MTIFGPGSCWLNTCSQRRLLSASVSITRSICPNDNGRPAKGTRASSGGFSATSFPLRVFVNSLYSATSKKCGSYSPVWLRKVTYPRSLML